MAAIPAVLRFIAIALFIMAFARPQEGHKRTEILSQGVDIILAIDTSGSMFRYAWPKVIEQFVETLTVYPKLKGIQIMNDMGAYMFSSYRGQWIPDTPGRRQAIIDRLRTWNAFSNSSPVEGIMSAAADCDMVVIGATKERLFRNILIGNVSELHI